MTKHFCAKCGKDIAGYPGTKVEISWSFFRKVRNYALCTDCDQLLRNIVVRFLDAD